VIIHLIGQPGSGKSTISKKLFKVIPNAMLLDGDELREIFKNQDYSQEGRRRNLTNAYNIARFLETKGFVPIIAMVSPYLDLREELKSQSDVIEIFLHTSQVRGREKFFVQDYEKPTENYLSIDTSEDINECLRLIKIHLILKDAYS
jgi:adenylylsulfate kinase